MGLKILEEFIGAEIKDITIDIHVIGKYPQGESIIFILNINKTTKYCLVVDYCDENLSLIKEKIFTKYNIQKINLLCWSHPHLDHSMGIIDLVKEYCKKDSIILLPVGLENAKKFFDRENEENKINDKKTVKETYEYFLKINKKGTKRFGEIKYASEYKQIQKKKYKGIEKNVELYIEVYSPIDRRINNIRNLQIPNLNDYSILMTITVNGRTIIFTSDIENNSIKDVINNNELFENVVFIKIPHHGGNSSKEILDAININENRQCYSVSTIYANNGKDYSPNPDVLQAYKNYCDRVFCTSSKYINNINTDKDYGIVSTIITIPTTNALIEKIEYDFDGDAIEI